jgi:uncharacterized protein (DUF1697 family)
MSSIHTPSRALFLLRAINVGKGRSVPMDVLRLVAESVGLADIQTYLQSGNLVATCEGDVDQLASALHASASRRFGFEIPVVARSAQAFARILAQCPFPDARDQRPERLLLGLAASPLSASAQETLSGRAAAGERVAVVDDCLWLDLPHGVGTSKLTPALIDRACGAKVTCRNYRTASAITELLRAPKP